MRNQTGIVVLAAGVPVELPSQERVLRVLKRIR